MCKKIETIRDAEMVIMNGNIKVGTMLLLNENILKCIDTVEDEKYGTRYVFDNGLKWTKSNIINNIVKHMTYGNRWAIKYR